MKRCLLSLTLAGLFAANLEAADISRISDAFKGGNASTLSACMDQEVDLALEGGASVKYAGQEAVGKLGQFFQANKPSGFQVIHHADKKDCGFFVAKLKTGGKEYRVNITYRTDNNQAIIQSIRIE